MRRSYAIVLITLLAMLTLTVAVVGVERIANKFVLYVRVARLYTQDPPRKIVMPLQVPKKQIANTWQAPRGAIACMKVRTFLRPAGHRPIQLLGDTFTILDKTDWEGRLFL